MSDISGFLSDAPSAPRSGRSAFDRFGIPPPSPAEIESFLGPEPPSIIDRLGQGIRNTMDAERAALTSDPVEIAGIIASQRKRALPPTEAVKRMAEEIKPYQEEYQKSSGAGAIIPFASMAAKRLGQFATNPKEFTGMMAENLPNSVPGIVGMVGGAAAGTAVGGPVGSIIGGVAGGTAASYGIEQGSAMLEKAAERAQAAGVDINDKAALTEYIRQNYPTLLEDTRLKGIGTAGTDAILNRATLGMAGAGTKAIVKEADALTDAVKAGTMTAEQAAPKLAELQAKDAARNTIGAKVTRGAGVTGAEMVGEGVSEAVGQKLGYGEVNALDVIDEGLLGAGQGLGMAAGSNVINKAIGAGSESDSGNAIAGAVAGIGAAQNIEEAIAAFTKATALPAPGGLARPDVIPMGEGSIDLPRQHALQDAAEAAAVREAERAAEEQRRNAAMPGMAPESKATAKTATAAESTAPAADSGQTGFGMILGHPADQFTGEQLASLTRSPDPLVRNAGSAEIERRAAQAARVLPAPDSPSGRGVVLSDGDPELNRPEQLGDLEAARNREQREREQADIDRELGLTPGTRRAQRARVTLNADGSVLESTGQEPANGFGESSGRSDPTSRDRQGPFKLRGKWPQDISAGTLGIFAKSKSLVERAIAKAELDRRNPNRNLDRLTTQARRNLWRTIVKAGGISDKESADIGIDPRSVPGYRMSGLISPKGMRADILARLLAENGYLTERQMQDGGDEAARQVVADMLAREFTGTPEEADQYHAALSAQNDAATEGATGAGSLPAAPEWTGDDARFSAGERPDSAAVATLKEHAQTESAVAAATVARMFGRTIAWRHMQDALMPDGSVKRAPDGYFDPAQPDTLYINANTKRDVLAVFGHELLHSLRHSDEAIYRQLLDRIQPLMRDEPRYREWLASRTGLEGDALTDLTAEEMTADFFGEVMTQQAFWDDVFSGQDKSWIERVISAVSDALQKIAATFDRNAKLRGKAFGAQDYIKEGRDNIAVVRKAMADAFNAWQVAAENQAQQIESATVHPLPPPLPSPAANLGAYTFKTAKAGSRPVYANRYIGLGTPEVLSAKGLGFGTRRIAYRIYDRRQDDGLEVGFVIVDVNREGKFESFRNIEIARRYRQKGLGYGEAVVASMLQHNGATLMKVSDITHAGRVGTPDDALPFWKKTGIVLTNYSSDPDIPMDGVLTRDAYLQARQPRSNLNANDQAIEEAEYASSPEAGTPAAGDLAPPSGNPDTRGTEGVEARGEGPQPEVRQGEVGDAPERVGQGTEGDKYGLRQFGLRSVDDVSPAYRNPQDWREVPAAMRDVDAASALRREVADLEGSLNRAAGRTAGSEPIVLSLDDNGNINIARFRVPGESQDSLIARLAAFADQRDLGIIVRRSAFLPKSLTTKLERYGPSINYAATGGDAWGNRIPNPVDSTRNLKGAPLYSPADRPEWIEQGPAALKAAAAKIDTYAPKKSIRDKISGLSRNWKEGLVQGMFDAFAPLKRLDPSAYVAARMARSADGAFEGLLMYGKPVMDKDGALRGDLDGKGFLGAMQELNGEHDRFLMWLAGNRSARLAGEGREHLFDADEIAAMKALGRGKMADGKSRELAYGKALSTFNAYNKAVLDIAEQTGLIDGEARATWEAEIYVPFFRTRDNNALLAPSEVKGQVRTRIIKELVGGNMNLGDLMDNTLKNWSRLLSSSMSNVAAAKALLAAEKAGVAIEAPKGDLTEIGKSIGTRRGPVYFLDHGAPRWFLIDDPFVLDAITSITTPQFDAAPMKLLGTFKRMLTVGVTISPGFRVRNLLRDSLAAIGQNDMSTNVMSNLVKGWQGTDRKSSEYAQMLFGGALMRFGTYLDGDNAEHVKRLIEAGIDDKTILDTPEKVKVAATKAWDAWQEFGDRVENVNRSALYKKLAADGMSHQEASFQARDMMDFSLQGSWTAVRFLTQVVPFMNARLQGLYKLGRAAKDDPKRLGYVVGAVSLASIALLLAYQDDEEWKKREDWDRDNFWWFRIGDTAFRIPKPFEIGALGTIAERSVEYVVSNEMTGKRFGERMKAMVADTFALNPVPQAFKPMVDLYANKDSFTGRAIESRSMEHLSKSERAGVNTSLVAKVGGKAADVTGLSPVQIDHLIKGYFGWLGSHAAMTVDLMARPFDNNAKPGMRLQDLTMGFSADLPAQQSRYLNDFYKQARAVQEVMGDLKHARQSGDLERMREIQTTERQKIALHRMYDQTERHIGKINTQIRLTEGNARLSGEEKRERLDRLGAVRNALAKRVEVR
jgi:hypothetical protein